MAYKIQYSQETDYLYSPVRSKKRYKPGRWLLPLLLLVTALWLRRNGIPDFLIPGDPDITKSAALTMIDELQNGVSLNESVTAFCETIIHGAGH